jgi:hypothetical protein
LALDFRKLTPQDFSQEGILPIGTPVIAIDKSCGCTLDLCLNEFYMKDKIPLIYVSKHIKYHHFSDGVEAEMIIYVCNAKSDENYGNYFTRSDLIPLEHMNNETALTLLGE